MSGRRFGLPQVFAVLLLLAFMAQAAVLISQIPLTEGERSHVLRDAEGWTFYPPVSSAHRLSESTRSDARTAPETRSPHSPLTSAITDGMLTVKSNVPRIAGDPPERPAWILRLPFLIAGVLLGASLWYVARRLYGNAAGYIALALFAFSPTMVTYSARVQPEILAAWGTFGCVFTGIAVAHTLYAPREVVLWNWKRILLLGVSIAVGVGAQLSVAVAIPLTLLLMFYLVPERRGAALAIIGAACAIGFVLLLAITRLHLGRLATGVPGFSPRLLGTPAMWRMVGLFLVHNSAGFVLLFAVAISTFALWRHTRFFGTAAPLIVTAVLVVLAIVLPHAGGFVFLVMALPFAFVFIAGVSADLLQSRYASFALGVILAVLVGHAAFSLTGLWQLK